ncbi:hypothetical protein BIW11_03791 [Tropilaelaps mercedesae]|uniref:Chitin-binding type-2 domain-containing protein n=1 Tax=Tropilaelaps mercedesae TaxID=418985 RepID=A0A1V9XG16_9ACAR|nr:hypothetical protein BIW11_03791 [Tropilaelaps mercedesae]
MSDGLTVLLRTDELVRWHNSRCLYPRKSAIARLVDLPSGSELLVDQLETSFHCPDAYGYFADEDHQCRIFHICNPMETGMQHYSFVCGNQTVFDQLTLSCSHPEDAIPCEYSRYFAYINDRVGTRYNLHYDTDIERAVPYVPNRLGTFLFDSQAKQSQPDDSHYTDFENVEQPQSDTSVEDTPTHEEDRKDLRSHQRQSFDALVGHDFTVFHPQGGETNPQNSPQERRALRNSIRRRVRAKNSVI